jgi:uncharacterized protein (DUF302 family)
MAKYEMKTVIKGTLQEVRAKVAQALKEQGFGVLTEIDAQKTLKEKLGIDFKPYLILGACNPHLAHQALDVDPSIGLLLPCNVVLQAEGDAVEVSIIDPELMFSFVEPEVQAQLAALPGQAKSRLQAALKALEESG